MNHFELIAQSATKALNEQIGTLLPGCALLKATLKETKQGELSFHIESGEIIMRWRSNMTDIKLPKLFNISRFPKIDLDTIICTDENGCYNLTTIPPPARIVKLLYLANLSTALA